MLVNAAFPVKYYFTPVVWMITTGVGFQEVDRDGLLARHSGGFAIILGLHVVGVWACTTERPPRFIGLADCKHAAIDGWQEITARSQRLRPASLKKGRDMIFGTANVCFAGSALV